MADALPLADESVDVATATLLLHHLDPQTKERALAEMRRVLRPGGRLVLPDWGHRTTWSCGSPSLCCN
jgi:ubiquinone/menaquinone biosynthesis C-methylase UbiE